MGTLRKIEQVKNAQVVFEQYWLHARHVENHRLWLTNVFVAIFVGLIAYMAEKEVVWYLAACGLVLSIFGLLMVHATRVPFLRFSRMAEIIMDVELGLGRFRRFYRASERENVGKMRVAERIDKFFSVHRTYVLFYCFTIAGWASLIVASLGMYWWGALSVFPVVFLIVCLVYYWVFWRQEVKVEDELRKLYESLRE